MTKTLRPLLVLALAIAGCGSGGGGGSGVDPATAGKSGRTTGGTSGASSGTSSGGAGGGDTSSAGSGGSSSAGAAGTSASGGSGGTASGGGGTAATTADDAAAGAPGADVDAPIASDASGASTGDASSAPTSAGSLGWYEAEAGTITGRAVKATCTPCPSRDTMKPGDTCCSGGSQVQWLVSHGNGELQFNAVSVPADGTYDVTWWYYCGKNDNFGDKDCGGQTNPPTTKSGCRPHQFIVNGTQLTGTYHFPCFDGMWNIIRAATVAMPLKAGAMNTIKLHAPPPRDSVNVDAIELFPSGKGLAPTIMSNSDSTGH